MKIPQIRLQSQMAQIEIHQKSGKQTIQQPKAHLSIRQPKAKLSFQTTPAKVNIDQSQAWAEVNLKNTQQHIEEIAQAGKEAAQEGAQRRAKEGSELMRIEHKRKPVVEQAVNNGFRQLKEISLTYIPSPFSVNISATYPHLHIDVEPQQPEIEATLEPPIHHYERGVLEIKMKKYQQLNIDFVNLFSESI